MNAYERYLMTFLDVKSEVEGLLLKQHKLRVFVGDWYESAVLKIQKESWATKAFQDGVFFSIWIDDKSLKKSRVNYNIHALGMRLWSAYQVKPVEFAKCFRERFKAVPIDWPNVDLGRGPQTLMQGWIDLVPETLGRDTASLVSDFMSIHSIVDGMLEDRKL